jgi:mono/diheme cytochrome c family protein
MSSTSSLPRILAFLLAGGACLPALASDKPEPVLEKGRYLTHNVAGCIDCHSPRDERGQFIADRHLTGAVLGFAPTVPMPWAPAAPSLVGLEGYTAEQAVKFLMTGERPGGIPPRPPMPEYRLTAEDAKAVVAYLKSLAKKA